MLWKDGRSVVLQPFLIVCANNVLPTGCLCDVTDVVVEDDNDVVDDDPFYFTPILFVIFVCLFCLFV
jgi:hypothetical protein